MNTNDVGQVDGRLVGLEARADLNGVHVSVIDDAEAAELQAKGRVKVRTALVGEILSVKRGNVETSGPTAAAFSTSDFAVVPHDERGGGYAWRALRRLPRHRLLLREEPLVVQRYEAHLHDPVVQGLQARLEPYLDVSKDEMPREALAVLDQSAARMAELEYEQLPSRARRKWMALSDAFSIPPATKTAANVMRTNSFSHDSIMGLCMYETCSRINHSCNPNLTTHFDGFTLVVTTLREIMDGEELFISYIKSAMEQPTAQRRHKLLADYNFTCVCERCGPAVA